MMGSEWETTTLERAPVQIIDGDRGKQYPKQSDFAVTGYCLFLNAGNVTPSGFEFSDCAFISEDRDCALRKGRLERGDVVLTTRGTVGNVALYGNDIAYERLRINSGMVILRSDRRELVSKFLYYYCRSSCFRNQMAGLMTGSAQPQLPIRDIKRLRIPLPPLPEQYAIAHILGTLDDKIELNRRMNETLEAMARAIFKSWFVDFDPVRAKAEGRDPGLPKHIADLFPDSFEDSELGEIPTGWSVGTLGDVALLNPESWSKNTRPPVISYVDLTNTKWGRIDAITVYVREDAPSRAQRVLRPLDTIVGTVRPGNGSYAFIDSDGLTGSTGFAVLRPRNPEFAEFVYLAATSADRIDFLAHLADGGAYPAVRPEVVAAIPIAMPGIAVMTAFHADVVALLRTLARNDLESRTLASLRDALLPKLISGELRVEEADENMVGAAVWATYIR